jgi:hypothetical protein
MYVYTTLQLYLKGFSVTLSGRGILRVHVHGVRVGSAYGVQDSSIWGFRVGL